MKKTLNFLKALAVMLVGAAVNGMLMAEGVVATESGNGVVVTGEALNTEVTNTNSPDLIKDTVDDVVTKIRPSKTPLVSILMQTKARKKKAESMKFGFYSIDIRPKEAITTADVAQGTNSYADMVVDNASIFDATDTVRVVSGDDEYLLYVEKVDSKTNTLSVQLVYDDNNGSEPQFPAIASGAKVYRSARAAAEGDVTTVPYSALPTKEQNYCQIFKMQVGETTIQKLSAKEVNWTPDDIEEQAAYEYKAEIETAYLFNRVKGHFFNNTVRKHIYTTQGIVPIIEAKGKKLTLPTVPSNEDFITLCKDIFVGNSGSEKRILFGGSEFVERISKVKLDNTKDATKTEVVWGITWNVIESNFGQLLLIHHSELDRNGYTDKGIVLDPQFIEEYEFMPTQRDVLDLRKAGIFDGDMSVTTRISGVAVKYPSCHGVISFV
jgi:hypothetical protein